MRLLITIPQFSPAAGGAETFALAVCRGLAARGHDIHVAATTRGDDVENIHYHPLGCLAEAEALSTKLQAEITLDWGLNTSARVHRLGGGTHREFLKYKLQATPALLRPLKALEVKVKAKHRFFMADEQRLLAEPHSHYIAVSQFVADQIKATAPIGDDRIHILHNGVDVSRFREPADTTALRRELGLSEDHLVGLFVAHNLSLKNYRLLKRVFTRLYPLLPNLRLVILGKRRPRTKAPWLVYAGATANVVPYYQMADMLVHPTYYDACANVVLEAMAAGCVVVSSDLNGSAEVLSTGVNGFVLPVNRSRKANVQQWSELIGWLAQDSEIRQRIGQAAAELARNYTMDKYLDRLEKILLDLRGS